MDMKIVNNTAMWERIAQYAKKAGRTGIRPVLLLYYVMTSSDTPKSDKFLIVSALSYLVFPMDVLSSKRLPVIGWIDEVMSLAVAYRKACKYVTPEIEAKVDALLDKWFPEYTLDVGM